MYTGLLSNNVTDLHIPCSTGNCTWPVIETLGMCGACVDVRPGIVKTCNATDCIWHIPGGLNVTRPVSPDPENWWITTPIFQAGPSSGVPLMEANVTGNMSVRPTISFAFVGLPSAIFMGMNDGDFPLSSATPWAVSNLTAAECGLWQCNQTCQVKASSGIVTDIILSTVIDDDIGWLKESPLASSLTYILTGEINVDGNFEMGYNMTAPWEWVIPRVPSFGVDALHAAWVYAEDVDSWWANLVKSLTNNIRMNGLLAFPEEGKYDGIAWIQVTHIRVRWVWLALPAALVLLSTIFLAATIASTHRANARPWKNRSLPILYARLDAELQEKERLDLSELGRSAKGAASERVVLDEVEGGYVFRTAWNERMKS
jgi:hypothetical protein